MKKLVIKVALFIILMAVTFGSGILFIAIGVPPQYKESYQYVINSKYSRLINMSHTQPKIIIIAGSSGAFGIDSQLVEEQTGMPVVTVALHADMGIEFMTEIAKENIQKDDIVIYAFEYGCWETLVQGADLICTGVDDNIYMYKYISKDRYLDFIKYIPTYTFKKLDYWLKSPLRASGTYSAEAFDEEGNMTLDRPKCILPPKADESVYGAIKTLTASNNTINYVNNFNNYVKEKGATLLVSFPPVLDENFFPNENQVKDFEKMLQQKIDATIISRINDYVFPRRYIFDTINHCNNEGEEKRSLLLSRDIMNYITKE